MDIVKNFLLHMVDPWLFMWISARQIPTTVRAAIAEKQWQVLYNINEFRDALFGHFWAIVGPQVKEGAERRVIPLLEGRVHNGNVIEKVACEPVSGRVLEVGAGSGMWADVFLKINTAHGQSSAGKYEIQKIFGVEPHPQSVKALRQRTKDLGMQDIYEAIPVGIEQLDDPRATGSATTIEPESIDCIVTILCLCSIPDQEKNIKALYKLLKPGGRWYVYEHVKVTRGTKLLELYQCEYQVCLPRDLDIR